LPSPAPQKGEDPSVESLRLARRLVLFGAWTFLCFAVVLASVPFVRLVRGETSHWRAVMMSRWARGTARIIGMRLHVEGAPPRPPFFLVSNHLGYVDVLVIASQVPCVFVAKSEIADWPLMGRLGRAANTLFISRENKRDLPDMLAKIERELRRGVGVVVFPEGTSSRGAEVLPFRAPLLEVAARGKLQVAYAAISYTTPAGSLAAHRAICYWAPDTNFGGHLLRLLRLPSFDARVAFAGERIEDGDRKALAARLHSAVTARFVPVP
jgi:1-acyl-sn-glycerol-3-phosphate acyltransferase